MIEFAHPWCFVILLVPVIIYLVTPVYRQRQDSIQVPYFNLLAGLSGETPRQGAVRKKRRLVQRILLAIAWACLVVAMAKPEWVGEPIVQQKSAREIMIAVDLSGSMEADDFISDSGEKINRLEAVKEVLTEFATTRENDRLGLILFADSAYLQAPFTENIDVWLELLKETELGIAGWETSIGDAIGLAITTFDNAQTDNRVLILLTDGTDTGSKMPPAKAATIAAKAGIKIHTIGIGSPETKGQIKLDLETLKTIAATTGGRDFLAMNRADLDAVYNEIGAIEKQQYETLSFRPRTSLHHYPFVLFCLLYLLAQAGTTLIRRFSSHNRTVEHFNG